MENNTKWQGQISNHCDRTGHFFDWKLSRPVCFDLVVGEQTASPMIMGVAGLAAYLPMAFLSPFAGVAADKYSRKIICITAGFYHGVGSAGSGIFA